MYDCNLKKKKNCQKYKHNHVDFQTKLVVPHPYGQQTTIALQDCPSLNFVSVLYKYMNEL